MIDHKGSKLLEVLLKLHAQQSILTETDGTTIKGTSPFRTPFEVNFFTSVNKYYLKWEREFRFFCCAEGVIGKVLQI